MKFENFEHLFHESWHNKLRGWVESEDCDELYKFLKKASGRGKLIAPLSSNTFRAFKETPFDELKVVFMGLSPYHTFINRAPVADGLLMSCSVTGRLQPSLEKFYNAIEEDLYKGLNLNVLKNPDLTYLASQGVLLTNVSLTVEMNKPGSHLKYWEGFMKHLLSDVLFGSNVPVVFLGREAGKYRRYVAPFTWMFELSHPASAAYNNTEWDCDNVFRKLNKILMDMNGYKIEWLKT